jgi:uncharacterized protein (TIGR02646 family)
MEDFRKITPARRNDAPKGKKYREYKSLLREDFNQRCGYCGDHDFFRETYYEVDHFVPKSLDKDRENDYFNLVYSCRSCNNSKRDKWPTEDITKPNDDKIGWIDPCDKEYAVQFARLPDGSIKSKTDLGQWMWKALTLGNPVHRLKWVLEELRNELVKTDGLDITDVGELQQIKELNAQYRRFEEQLRGFPNFS